MEDGLATALAEVGAGCIAFSPLAQGLLTDRYLEGIPEGSRATKAHGFLKPGQITPENLRRVRALDTIAQNRGIPLAAMALAWLLERPAVTSVLIGASSPEQIERNLAALDQPPFSSEELAAIDAACALQ